jgi:hypothetical protein
MAEKGVFVEIDIGYTGSATHEEVAKAVTGLLESIIQRDPYVLDDVVIKRVTYRNAQVAN